MWSHPTAVMSGWPSTPRAAAARGRKKAKLVVGAWRKSACKKWARYLLGDSLSSYYPNVNRIKGAQKGTTTT